MVGIDTLGTLSRNSSELVLVKQLIPGGSGRKVKASFAAFVDYLLYKYSHHGQFQTHNTMPLKRELKRDVRQNTIMSYFHCPDTRDVNNLQSTDNLKFRKSR